MARGHPSREIETLVRLSSMINSSLDIVEVLDTSMRFVEELMDAEASSIFELDHEKNELFFRMARGDSSAKAREIRIKMGEGIAGWVASSGEPLLVADTEKDGRFSKKVDDITGFRTKSIVALPIRNRGRIVGVLEVLNKRGPGSFDRDDLEVLTIAANQIGVALENARLYSRLEEKFTLTRVELKETQAKLLRSERLAALGQLSQGIAHEVRNPVMSIGGFARRIKKTLPPDDAAIRYLDIILAETARLEKMVKDIEQYTAMPEPKIQEVKLSAVLLRAIRAFEKEDRSETVKMEIEPLREDPTVFLDEGLMALALIHLLRNAREASQEGGAISISSWSEGKWMVISVKDNGPGIRPEDLPHVFDPFFTSKTRGSGLGLTTVNRIVGDHGGELKIRSTPGAGTDVRIYLPLLSLPLPLDPPAGVVFTHT